MSELPELRSTVQTHYQPELSPSDLFSGKIPKDEVSNNRAFRVDGHSNFTSHNQYLDGGNRALSARRRVLKEAFDILENDPRNRQLSESMNTVSSKIQAIDREKTNSSPQLNEEHFHNTLAFNREANVTEKVSPIPRNKLSNAFDLLLKTSPDFDSRHHYDGGERVSKNVVNTPKDKIQSTISWLNEVGMAKYERHFESNSISLDMLGHLSLRDLKKLIPLAEDRLRFRALVANASFTSSTEGDDESELIDEPSCEKASKSSSMTDYDSSKPVVLNSSLSFNQIRPSGSIQRDGSDINFTSTSITPLNTQVTL